MNEITLNEKLQKLSMLMGRLNRPEPMPFGAPRGRAQERALNQIAIRDGLTQRELMERLGVQPSTMSELLDKLEHNGLIERKPNEEDRRQVNLHLSESGRRHLEQANIDENRFDPFETLTDEEQQSFGEMLDRLIAFAEEECRRRRLPLYPPRPFPGGEPPFDGPRGHMPPPPPHHGRPPMDERERPRPVFLSDNGPEEKI